MAATLRLYRASRIGSGSRADPWRPALRRYIDTESRWQLWHCTDLVPVFYALVHAEPAAHAQCEADPDITPLSPERATPAALRTWLDGPLGSMSAALRTAIEGDGIPLDDIGAASTRAALLRRILAHFRMLGEVRSDLYEPGRLLAPWRHGTLGDVDPAVRQVVSAFLATRGIAVAGATLATQVKDVVDHVRTQRFAALACCGEALDKTLGQLPQAKRQQFRRWMEGRGLDVSWLTDDTAVRAVRKRVLSDLAYPAEDALGVRL